MAASTQRRAEKQKAPPGRYANVGTGTAIDDTEEGYVSGAESDKTSIASSVLNYVYENGRRYHSYGQGKYLMPNDETEQDRLDLTHHICLLLLKGELYNAPVRNPHKILDLGTGTGIWALDVAEKFRKAHVVGNDLSAIQPRWVPPNLEFVVEDFENEWLYEPDHFDFIHARTIAGCVQDWPRLLRQSFKHTKPGGYFEIQEFAVRAWSDDGTLKADSPYAQYLKCLDDAGKKSGRELNIYDRLKQWVIDAGYTDVVEKVYILPLAPWPKDPTLKELGRWQAIGAQDAVEAYGLRLYTQVLGWSAEEAKVHYELVKEQLKDHKVHAYTKMYTVYGRKPL
ncbi:hypothetical protein VTN00DRAFT_5059 [Thermoascus crustaceus]|uniref:uncharacterized protein n=1 Tax=Thermoascus crustaceus TaxID=5088 RepID=UPI0037447951